MLQYKWSLFAQEQSGRSFAILNRRRMSEDPQLQNVILICCLLFIMCELLHGNIGNALFHMDSGLRIVDSMNIQRHISVLELRSPDMLKDSVVETFLVLQSSAVFYGIKQINDTELQFVFQRRYEAYIQGFRTLTHARRVLNPLLHTTYLFVAQCMKASDLQMTAMYSNLQGQQYLLLSYLTQFLQLFEKLCIESYGTFSFIDSHSNNPTPNREQREAEITRLSALCCILGVKISLFSKSEPLPANMVPECEALIEAAEIAMKKFHDQAPILTAHHEIVPALYIAVVRCPDYGLHCRGIDAMRSWRSEENFMSANLNSDTLEEGLKLELKMLYDSAADLPPGLLFENRSDGEVMARILHTWGPREKEYSVVLPRNDVVRTRLRIL